jgi:membrane protease YdiL (CAAX protease family)
MDVDSPRGLREPVASWRHTATLAAILIAIALLGLLAHSRAASAGPPPPVGAATYAGLIAAEWGLFLYLRMGLKRRGMSIVRLVSARPLTLANLVMDAALGFLLLAILLGAGWVMDRLPGSGNGAIVQSLLVRDALLVPLWVGLSLSAGFVEELVFRGYFQRQLAALAGRPWMGIAAQALLFGVTHGYQGGIPILRITMLGLLFGAAAAARRSLVPGMVAHAGLDIIGGLAALR